MQKRRLFLMILISAVLLSACNFPLFAGAQEDEINALATAVAMTVQAMNNQPLPDDTTDDTPEPDDGLPTVTTVPTNTIQAPPTQTPQPCDKAAFVSETIPDDTVFGPGAAFTKSWTLRNVGTCAWNTDYKLKISSGEAMSGPASVNLSAAVPKDQQITIAVDLKAPNDEGTHTGYWVLTNNEGDNFAQVYVRIKVEAAPFAVTSVSTNLSNKSPGSCTPKYTMPYEIYIQSSAAGTVTYKVKRSDTGEGPTKSMVFDAAGIKTLQGEWDITADGTYSLEVYIDQPNNQWFGPYSFTVDCP